MGVKIAEYLGLNVDSSNSIMPVVDSANCPFMNAPCSKLQQGNKPICSVRKTNGDLWLVCKNRLCATLKAVPLNEYQKGVLLSVAKKIWGDSVLENEVLIKREVSIPVVAKSKYKADYIMIYDSNVQINCSKRVVLEMQGGGETSNTGHITYHVNSWEANQSRTNEMLSMNIPSASPIETNAWRRQQEQFITKGNIAVQTGGSIVFCVGKPLYDYLYQRIQTHPLNNLKNHNWTLCLIGFKENPIPILGDPIKYIIDDERVLFTNYQSFVQYLTNQGEPHPEMFRGKFENLLGSSVEI